MPVFSFNGPDLDNEPETALGLPSAGKRQAAEAEVVEGVDLSGVPRVLLFALVLTAVPLAHAPRLDAAEPAAPKVRLAVLVVFDQLRGDYLARWQPLFTGGFKRLQADAAWFANCPSWRGGGAYLVMTMACFFRPLAPLLGPWLLFQAVAFCARGMDGLVERDIG